MPVLPAGSVGAPDGAGLMINVSAVGTRTSVRGYDPITNALVRTVELAGRYTVPTVVPNGSTEGVAHNGSLFVLTSEPTAATSRFAVLDGRLDAPARIIELADVFTYDALAPDGSTLYLVEHLGPAGSQHYQVRSYDLRAQRLDEAVIVDKANIGEQMAGRPTSRVVSADGTIVATLYERIGGTPFIHVLNTVEKLAHCIDLPARSRGMHLGGDAAGAATLNDAAGLVRLVVDLTTGTTTTPTAGCTARLSRAALPEWARTGFTGDGAGVPHVISTNGDMIAALFGFPLEASPDPTVMNKVLWIPRPAASPSPGPSAPAAQEDDLALTIDATLAGTTLAMTRVIADGPGPSGVNFPQAGCWALTLHWYGRTDTMTLPVG